MAGGDACTLSLCVYSAELESAAHGAYCKVYVDANDRTNGSGAAASQDTGSPDPSRGSDGGARSFHTHVEKSEKKTYLPTWNETFTIDVYDRRHEILTIRLKSKKLLHVSVVGACAIPLHQIPTGQPVDQWFPVQKGGKRRGKLRLQMMITYPKAPLSSVGTPPQPGPRFGGYQDARPSLEQRSSGGSASLHQRPSSLSSQPSDTGRRSQVAAPSPQQPYRQQQQQQQQQPMTLASYRFEPEDEPAKERASPVKDDTYEIYRPATNPRVDLESDDDDETSFPRVAELHRLESDLIGESSDEEVEAHALMPKSPLYLERLTEADSGSGGEEGSPSFSTLPAGRVSDPRGSTFEQEASLTLDSFKPRDSIESKPAAPRRSSVEVTRQTKVSASKEESDHMLEASAVTSSSYDDADDEISMSGIAGGFDEEQLEPKSPSVGSHASDVVVGEVVAADVAQEVWNRYSSSSSEDLQLPYPDEDAAVARSSGSSDSIYEGIAVSIHEANPFVEPGSPVHSSNDEADAQQRFDQATTPRDSISSDGGDHTEFFGDDKTTPSTPPRKTSSPRASLSPEAVDASGLSRERHDSAPRNSWVSEDTNAGRDASISRTSWVSEDVEQHPSRITGRDKSWSGTSWVSEHENANAAQGQSPRSSWVSEHSEVTAPVSTSPQRSGRDKSYSGTSWISEHDSASIAAVAAINEESSSRHSWVSEKSEMSARHSWVSEKSEVNARHSWVSEKSDVVTSELPSPAPQARLTGRDKSWSGTSWINENDNTSFVDATGQRSSWVSEDGESHADDAASPRHSWVSEGGSDAPARLTGRDKSWSGTSWVSESDSTSVVGASDAPQASTSRSSWISESDENDQDTFESKAGSSARTSWVHEDGALPPRRLTGRDKSWSGTSWISENENTSFVDATGLRSSWLGDDDDVEGGESTSPRHSWVSETESATRMTGREKSWSGTSWVSEHDTQEEASRTSWISEHPDEKSDATVEDSTTSRHSWVSEAPSDAPARLTGRDKSWSGTSWISEQENTSFVDASRPQQAGSPRSSWISEDVDADGSSSPRHSWVSENVEPQPRVTGRDKSWSGTSWISEHESSSFVDASDVHQAGSPRHSWISEAESAVPDGRKVTSAQPSSPRHSWVSDSDHASAAVYSPRTSWVSESVASEVAQRQSSPRNSWVSEDAEHADAKDSGSPRNSWVSEESSSTAHRRRVSSSQTSWVNENTNSNSFVNASFTRHSFVSEGSVEDHTGEAVEDPTVAILPAPVRDSVDASSPARVSLLSEISDIIEAEHNVSPRSSISAEPTSEPASQTDTFVSDRISSASSVEFSERQQLAPVSVEATAPYGSARDSYSSEDGSRHARFDSASTPRVSMSSARLSMEEDSSSATRVSFVSDERVTETSTDAELGMATPQSDSTSVHVHVEAVVEQFQSRSSEEGRSSGYDGDNIETSTTRSSSLFSEQAHERNFAEGLDTATPRSHSSSESDEETYRPSSFTESYTDLTRHSSISSAGVENVVDRDDAERHAEAVAEAARYSSSSEGEFDRDGHGDLPSALKIQVTAPRRYSSASEEDEVDRGSTTVGFEYDDLSAGRSHSSSTAARDEAQFAAWTEESSTGGDFGNALDRGSQATLSDMYDASPRTSDLGIIPESHARVSTGSQSSSVSLEFAPTESGMHRFVSSANVFVEPYDDGTPRSSASDEAIVQREDEVIDTAELHPISSSRAAAAAEALKVTVTVELPQDEVKPAPVNPFVEYGSPRSSSSSEGEFMAEVLDAHAEMTAVSRQSSHSSEGDHEVIVVETLDQLAGPVESKTVSVVQEVVETKSSRVSSITSDRLSSTHVNLDNLLATREFVDAGNASPLSSLSSTSPRDAAFESVVAAGDLLERAAEQCQSTEVTTTKSAHVVSTSETVTTTVVAAASVAANVETPPASSTVRFSSEEDESKADEAGESSRDTAVRQNVRGDHVLVSAASSLTRAQLQAVAQDFLPSDDSESDEYDSDAELNFDSD